MAKRKYGKWQSEDIQTALAEFKEGKIVLHECWRWNCIPKHLFKRHLEGSSVHRGVCKTIQRNKSMAKTLICLKKFKN
jgi:hypothetical protein